jgi:hypothetical protein
MSEKSGMSAPPLPLEAIRTRLALKLFPHEAGAITRCLMNYSADSHNMQVLTLTSILCDQFQSEYGKRHFGLVFGVNKGTIHKIRRRGMSELETRIRQTTLSHLEQATQVIEPIKRHYLHF